MEVKNEALVTKENVDKKVFQLSFFPSKVARDMASARALLADFRVLGEAFRKKKDDGYRTVILVDGRSGASPDQEILRYMAAEIVKMEGLLKSVDNIVVANADTATTLLWRICSTVPSLQGKAVLI